jgi:hypothetical protein
MQGLYGDGKRAVTIAAEYKAEMNLESMAECFSGLRQGRECRDLIAGKGWNRIWC